MPFWVEFYAMLYVIALLEETIPNTNLKFRKEKWIFNNYLKSDSQPPKTLFLFASMNAL